MPPHGQRRARYWGYLRSLIRWNRRIVPVLDSNMPSLVVYLETKIPVFVENLVSKIAVLVRYFSKRDTLFLFRICEIYSENTS